MSSTVDQIVSKFRRKFPECDAATALGFFQDAHRRILTRVQVRNNVQYIALVAGTREYALDASVFKVHSAYLEQSAEASVPLRERSTDELDVMRYGWRMPTFTGDPIEYYISAAAVSDSATNSIGFVPIPATSTSGTYPRVALYCTAYADLSGAETVPTNLLDDNVYLYRMYQFWGDWIVDPKLSQYWSALADQQMDLNHEHVTNLQSKGMTGFVQAGAFMSTRVR